MLLSLTIASRSLAFPLRGLQSIIIEPGSNQTKTECAEGEEDCTEVEPVMDEVEEKGLEDAELIAIIVGAVIVLIVALTVSVVVYYMCKHR